MAVNKVVFGAVSIMDISDSTVTADKLAKGVTAYDKTGEKITGTMEASSAPILQEKTVTPSTAAQSITADNGYDGLSKVTVNGDANLTADNIKSGTSIFGVTGSYAGSTPNLQSKSVTYTSNGTATITPDSGYDGLSSVDVTVNVASGGGEMVNVSFKDTNFNRRYTIYSYDENGNLFCVIDNVQINSTPSVFTVAKRGFVITNNENAMGGNSTDGLRFSGMTPVTNKRKERLSWGFIVTGDNPSLEVYDAS